MANHAKLMTGVLLTVSLTVATGLWTGQLMAAGPRDGHGPLPALEVVAGGAPSDGARPAPATDLYADPLPPGALVRLGTVRLRHGGHAALAFSENGRTLISANAAYARFWDPATGALVRQVNFPLPPPPPHDPVAARSHGRRSLSPDGKILAAWYGCSLHFWYVATGKEHAHFSVSLREFGPKAGLGEFVLSADGKTVALDIDDEQRATTVQLRDLGTGKERWRHSLHSWARMLLFSPDDALVAADDSDRLYRRPARALRHGRRGVGGPGDPGRQGGTETADLFKNCGLVTISSTRLPNAYRSPASRAVIAWSAC
jgi:hypothetical protein